MSVETLLADMRRKYLHAKAAGGNPDWLKGEPITARILEQWIPEVEAYAARLAEAERLIARIDDDCREGLHDCSFLASNPPQNPCAFHVIGLIRSYRSNPDSAPAVDPPLEVCPHGVIGKVFCHACRTAASAEVKR